MPDLSEVLDRVIEIGRTEKYSIKLVEDIKSRRVFFFDIENNNYGFNINTSLGGNLPNPNSIELFKYFLKHPIKTLTYVYYHAKMVGRGLATKKI